MQEKRMDKVTSTLIGEVVMVLLYSDGAHTATKYVSEDVVVRATRPLWKKKLSGEGKRDTQAQVVVTIGKPNFKAREFIKACKRAGEPFPVKKIQLNMVPGR